MSAVTSSIAMSDASMMALINRAAAQIAPQWPLDQLIAVNPWWPKRRMSFAAVCAEQQLLAGTDCLMSAQWYLTQYQQQITPQHLRQALDEAQLAISVDEAVAALSKSVAAGHWQRLTGHLSAETQQHKLPWQQLIVQQLSQFLALYHQYPERFSVDADSNNHAYHSWLSVVRQDKGLQVLTGTKLTPLFVALPDDPCQLLAQMQPWLDSWCADEQSRLAYFEALLQGLSGWAGWQAWLDWQQQLQGNSANEETIDTTIQCGVLSGYPSGGFRPAHGA